MSRDPSKRQILYEGEWLRLISERGWEYIEHRRVRGIVVMIARTREDRLLLVEQERIPLGQRTLELPAGMVGDRDGRSPEDATEAARRELLEETGYAAARVTPWFAGPMSPGRSADMYMFYIAEDLRKETEGGGDDHEDIRVHEMPLADAEDWLRAREAEGLLIDPKIFIGLYALRQIKEC